MAFEKLQVVFQVKKRHTSVHDSFLVHVIERLTQLLKILPNSLLRNQSFLLLEVLNHPREIPRVCQFQHYQELVVEYEGLDVSNDVGVIQLFQKIDFFDAVITCFCICHLVDLQSHTNTVHTLTIPLNI